MQFLADYKKIKSDVRRLHDTVQNIPGLDTLFV